MLIGVNTPGFAPRVHLPKARVLLVRIAQGDIPVEPRELDHRAITVKELCERSHPRQKRSTMT